MKIIALTDIHGHLEAIDRIGPVLKSADWILLCGDLTHFGRDAEVRRVIGQVRMYNQNLLAVSGNCDHPQVETYLKAQQMNLHGHGRIINGMGILGLGGSLPCPGHTPNEFSEEQLAELLQRGWKLAGTDHNPFILVSHQPPRNTLNDRVATEYHVGSEAVRTFIERYQPLICLTGHIHEGIGIDTIGQTRIVNPGPLRMGGYTWLEIDKTITMLEIRSLV
jgi:uncharacterized protein